MPESASDFLKHYGVPGMKWGKRTSRGGTAPSKRGKRGEPTPKAKAEMREKRMREGSEDFRTSRELGAKPPHTLSNAQLKKVNERLQLERSYSELTTPKLKDKQTLKKVNEILEVAGTAQKVYGLSRSLMVKDVRSAIDKNAAKKTEKQNQFANARGLPAANGWTSPKKK